MTISLPAGAWGRLRDFNATVIARVKAEVVLEPIDIDIEFLPNRNEGVFVSFGTGSGLVALKGVLTRERDALRFRVQDGIRVHARRYTRVDAELRVSLQRADAEKGWSGTTVNIAQEGLLVRTQLPVALHDEVAVMLWLPGVEQPSFGRRPRRPLRQRPGRVALRRHRAGRAGRDRRVRDPAARRDARRTSRRLAAPCAYSIERRESQPELCESTLAEETPRDGVRDGPEPRSLSGC